MAAEKPKTPNYVKHVPKDAQVILSIMKDMGITDYEPKVVNQLLEYTYRYVTSILDDGRIFANHSKKKVIDLEDIRLAVKLQLEQSFTNPPPRDVLMDIAKNKNSTPLPFVKHSNGLRLPPDRYCLNGANYKLKTPTKKSGKIGFNSNSPFGQSRMNAHKALSIVKRPGNLPTLNRTQTISVNKPVFKINTAPTANAIKSESTQIIVPTASGQDQSLVAKVETDDPFKNQKEDDDYDA